MKFKQTNKLVLQILERNPKTRNSDNLLYLAVIEELHPGMTKDSIGAILLNLESLGLPCFETIRRTRQKIQAERTDLQADAKYQDYRTALEEQYRAYCGGVE